MERLLKHLKVKPNQTAVIGDWYNDISLFETDAFKVAVANAIPEIRKMADIVTSKSNNDEGAVEFFKNVLKAKRN